MRTFIASLILLIGLSPTIAVSKSWEERQRVEQQNAINQALSNKMMYADKVGYGPKPTHAQMKKAVETWMYSYLKDPYTAQYSFASDAGEAWRDNTPMRYGAADPNKNYWWAGWGFCVDVNAKNSFGGYTGAQRYLIYMKNGKFYTSRKYQEYRGSNLTVQDPWWCRRWGPYKGA